MKKKMRYSILYYALIFLPVALSAQQVDQFAEPIESGLLSQFGEEYELFIAIPADSAIGTNKGQLIWALDDPYDTLQGKVLFAARNLDTDWIWGIYREQTGQIVWTSEPNLECSDIYFYGAMDLNLDETVDIAVNCLLWSNTVVTGYLWIYSWDGTDGWRISDSWGGNALASPAHESFGHMDLNGDGVLEIRGKETKELGQWSYWSWNGNAYGSWPSTPSPPSGPFYPADMAEGEVEVEVTKTDTGFVYQYEVISNSSSKRRISEFFVDHGKPEKVGETPPGWRFNGVGLSEYPFSWKYNGGNTRFMISPGDSLSGFKLYSSTQPGVYNFYVRSEHKLPDYNNFSYSFEEDLNDIRTNSHKGITLAPGPVLENLDNSQQADSLRSYLDFSCGNGWVTNHGICGSLEAKMENVAKQLGKDKIKQAINGLNAFLNEVDAQRGKHITEEGYAMLYYNAEYLKEQLEQQTGGGKGNKKNKKR